MKKIHFYFFTNIIINIIIIIVIITQNLGNCEYLNLKNCPRINDLSQLGNVHELNISNSHFGDNQISFLTNIKKLNINCCDSITDVRPLCNAKTLLMSNCTNVIDICRLADVGIDYV